MEKRGDSISESVYLFKQLTDYLCKVNYASVQRLPLREYKPLSVYLWFNEIAVFCRFFANRNNLFSISLCPSVYSRIYRHKDLMALRDMFFLNKPFPPERWKDLFPEAQVTSWHENGLMRQDTDNNWRFLYRIVPYNGFFFVTSRFDRSEPHFTYLSYDSVYFVSFLQKRMRSLNLSGCSVLDVCCGVGIQSLALSTFFNKILGVDVNSGAVKLANINAQLNKISNCEFRTGKLFEGIEGKFDLIVSNPPFIFSESRRDEAIDSFGGEPFGLGVTFEIIKKVPAFLTAGGRAFIITRSPILNGDDYLLANLREHLGEKMFCCYHHVSDSVAPLASFEKKAGVRGYRQVILEFSSGNGLDFVRSPFLHRTTSLF